MAGNQRAVREESHLDEMRSAIRGDFERLAERRGEQELMRLEDDEPPEPAEQPEPEAEPQPEPDPEQQPQSWLSRLLGL